MTSETINIFLSLVRQGIGHYSNAIYQEVDWQAIQALANEQGLEGVVVDGIEQLPSEKRPPKEVLLQWIGEVLKSYEYRFKLYCRAIADLSSWYHTHGYRMMILKGYACSIDWPKPEHRPCGDIDIWLFGKQKEADVLLSKAKGIIVDDSHHHHTVFEWQGFTVENHYDFVNVHDYKSSKELEGIFKELSKKSLNEIDLYGEGVYIPSANFHALFLLRHMVSHFASTRITLRQVLDWAFLVEKHNNEIDWEWLLALLDKYHMHEFFDCVNSICIENLGFDAKNFPISLIDVKLKERVLNDIFSPVWIGNEPNNLPGRIVFKTIRWKSNWWKQDLCYNESRWTGFWRGVWYHLLKPSSI